MNLPAIKNEMDEYAKGLLYQIIPNNSWSNVCYTYRISNKLAGSVYKIALNDALPEELKEWLKTIELAHIKRQHYAAKQTLDFRFSAPKIKAVYNRLKPLFDDPVSDIDNMYDIFEDYIFKMLRDWEVFTNDFTEDEVRYLDTLYPDECIIDGQPVIHLLPQDVGYPPGLTANEYLLLILQNPEQWFTNQMSAMQQAMDDLQKRKQNNGTQGGCNTNQSGASSSGGGAEDQNHNKEDRERPKKNPPQNQQGGQNRQQNQQPQNQQGNQNDQSQNGQDDQGMGSSQQNQDAAANTQQQEWKDGKDSNGGSNGSSGKQPNSDKPEQTDSSSKGSGKGESDDKSEQDGQSDGGSSDGQGVEDDGNQDESRFGGSSSDSDKRNSDDADEENQAGGSGTSDEDNGEDSSESEPSNGGADASDDTGDSEDDSGEPGGNEGSGGEEGAETADGESSSDGSEVSDSDASDTEDDSGERRELTKEELDELIKQFFQKAVSDYQKMLEIKDEQEADSNSLKGYSREGGGGAGNGTVLVDKCSTWIDFEGLEKEIRELMINRCVTVSKRDLLYNYNRGRGCGDVLTPRYREQTTYDEVPMTVVLDVSGSISDKNILGFCNIFKNVSKTCGKKCKIVMWDTNLRAIYDSGDDIKAVSGGGTDIGRGIDYVRKNFQPSEIGNLFVVSDCEDDLEDWSLDGFEQPYLVCWSSMDVIKTYTGSLFNEFVDSFEKILVKK
jgi:hypothetical protein